MMTSEVKTFEDELIPEEIAQRKKETEVCVTVFCVAVVFLMVYFVGLAPKSNNIPHKIQVSDLKIVSMDFIAELNKNSTTQQSHYLPLVSARWDLLIRVPGKLVGNDICLQGNLQASFLYKNVTVVTSSMQSYNKLESGTPQLLNVSAVATGEDLSGPVGKEIMEAIRERNEVRFGSRLSLTDCREETKKGTISYVCDEATLRFELDSDHIKGTAFGNHSTCSFNI